jgi:hypothetical protein
MRVTAELRCQLPNTSTALSSRSSRAGSRAKPGAAARAYLINKIYGENPTGLRALRRGDESSRADHRAQGDRYDSGFPAPPSS